MAVVLKSCTKASSKPHILFHRSTPWDSSIQCSTKTYASLFTTAGYSVTYLQDLANAGHWLLSRGYYHVWQKGCYWSNGVWVCSGLATIPNLIQFGVCNSMVAELSYRSCFPPLRRQVALSGLRTPDVIWSAKVGSGALKKIFPKSKLIMNVVDYYPAFHGDRVKQIERQDYSLADHIFVIGHTLKKYLVDELSIPAQRITVLGQGVAINRYERANIRPMDMPICDGPIAIWVGVLQKADVELMECLAVEIGKRGGCIVLIGPPGEWDTHKLQEEYIVRLGPRSSKDVSAYLTHADIGLMLYDRSRASVYKGQNPLKLYEYMAAGLSVLSTPHDEYDYISPPVIMVRTPEDMPEAVATALDRRAEFSAKGKMFAASHTWQSCFETASQTIFNLLE